MATNDWPDGSQRRIWRRLAANDLTNSGNVCMLMSRRVCWHLNRNFSVILLKCGVAIMTYNGILINVSQRNVAIFSRDWRSDSNNSD